MYKVHMNKTIISRHLRLVHLYIVVLFRSIKYGQKAIQHSATTNYNPAIGAIQQIGNEHV
jgi:hypothetical protein